MEEVDTRDRIAQHCREEALAVQDMLTPGATRRSRPSRIVEWLRMAVLPNDGSAAAELPETPSPATVLFDPSAAGPPFTHWYEPEQPVLANRKAAADDRPGIRKPAWVLPPATFWTPSQLAEAISPYLPPIARIHSGEEVAIRTVDCFNGQLTSEDQVPGEVLTLNRAASQDLAVLSFHLPFPGLGEVTTTGDGQSRMPTS